MFARALLLGLWWFSFCSAVLPPGKKPGIVLRITPSLLKFASDYRARFVLADYIRDSLLGMDRSKNCFADSCSLQDFTVNNYVPPKSNVTFLRGKGMQFKFEAAELDIELIFEFNKTDNNGSARVKGIASVHVPHLSLAAELALTRQNDGQLRIALIKCAVDVTVLGNDVIATWETDNYRQFKNSFYGKTHKYLEDRVNESLSTALCNTNSLVERLMPDGVKWLNKELASRLGILLDGTLVRELILDPEYIEVAYNGDFRMVGDKVGSSLVPSNLDLPPPDSSMVAFYISEYCMNTLYDVLFRKGWLQVNITKDLLPGNYSIYRSLFDTTCDNTLCVGTMFPQISEMHPNSSVTFVIKAKSPPSVTFSGVSQRSHIDLDLSIMIPRVNESEVIVAKLSIAVSSVKTVFMGRDRVEGEVSVPNITITDNGSPAQFVQYLPRINFVMKMMTDFIFLPQANYLGAIGMPLHLPFGLRLVNTDMRFIPGAFSFRTDVVNDPTPLIKDEYYIYSFYLSLLRRILA